jgi:protein-S-isoprenylcysteine O-methyltransferase Ste14
MTCFLSLFGWVALRVRIFDQNFGISLPDAAVIPGVILMVIGALLGLACAGVFVLQGRGTPAIFDAPRAFVVVGPYKYVRNPMYIGGLLLLMGFGFYERSISVLIFAVVLCLIVHLLVVFYEEPNLKRKFGTAYGDYQKAVRRWIPRLTR